MGKRTLRVNGGDEGNIEYQKRKKLHFQFALTIT